MSEKIKQLTPEEQARIQTERTLSDAEKIKDGVEYIPDSGSKEPRLEFTKEQVEEAREEMETELRQRLVEPLYYPIKKPGGIPLANSASFLHPPNHPCLVTIWGAWIPNNRRSGPASKTLAGNPHPRPSVGTAKRDRLHTSGPVPGRGAGERPACPHPEWPL